MGDLSDVTVGIKTFYRTDKLKNALKSLIGLGVKEVIVADDGPDDPRKERLYNEMSKELPLTVLRLPFNSGVSYGRRKIVENTRTRYLFIMDDDMEIIDKNTIPLLKQVLENDRTLGGVGALLLEFGKIKNGSHNLEYKDGYLIRDTPETIHVEFIDSIPVIRFDFIYQVGIFRTSCLQDYSWDEHYKPTFEHLDFFWGHKQLGKWQFAVTPLAIVKHNPGGDPTYRKFRFNLEEYRRSKEYFLKKWNLRGIINIKTDCIWPGSLSVKSSIWFWLKKHVPFKLLPHLMKIEEYWALRR